MERHPDLRRLSEDHHHALVLARDSVLAGKGKGPRSAQEQRDEAERRFAGEIARHFAIEEELLLPALESVGERDVVERTRADHAQLRGSVRDCVEATSDELGKRLEEFGRRLEAHVRFEERELFQIAQAKLAPEVLRSIAAACGTAR